MSLGNHLSALLKYYKKKAIHRILAHRICARHPTLDSDPTVIWDYEYGDLENIKIGKDVKVYPYAEILVYRHSLHGTIPGELSIGDRSAISTGANIRAAGGAITIGNGTAISQNTVLVATNHAIKPGEARLYTSWDESRSGVTIGDNVWIGANCVLLAGSKVGDNSVIAAGSVVRGEVPPNELWGGVPARRLKTIGTVTDASDGA